MIADSVVTREGLAMIEIEIVVTQSDAGPAPGEAKGGLNPLQVLVTEFKGMTERFSKAQEIYESDRMHLRSESR